jgi:hypothetical protein
VFRVPRTVAAKAKAARWWPKAAAIGRVAQPAWWVARAWAVFVLINQGVLPHDPAAFALAAAVLAASLLLGQVSWGAQHRLARLTMAGVNTALAVIAVIAGIAAYDGQYGPTAAGQPWAVATADPVPVCAHDAAPLCSGGVPVENLFAYDAQGQPIDVVLLFDANGSPVNVVALTMWEMGAYEEGAGEAVAVVDGEASGGWATSNVAPAHDVNGLPVFNAYPIGRELREYNVDGAVVATRLTPATRPFAAATPLDDSTPTPPSSSP